MVKWGIRESRGASMVELAFALPLLIMLLVGLVSSGIAYNNQLALTHAAREGGRYAATLPVNNFASLGAWLDEVVVQTVADGTGTLDVGVPGRYICVAYVYPVGTDEGFPNDQTARKEISESGTVQDGGQCMTDDRPDDERRVQVVVGRSTDFSVVFFSSRLDLDAEAVNRFEASQ